MSRKIVLILSQSYQFYNFCQVIKRKNVGLLRSSYCNLQNSRYFSLVRPAVSQNDREKLLKHLMNAYNFDKKTEFKELLDQHSVKHLINERMKILENTESLQDLAKDEEMKKLVEEEKLIYESQLNKIDDKLISLAIESLCGQKFNDIILEVTAGVGGQEAMLFVKDLFDMYIKHAAYLGYTSNIISLSPSVQGGFRYASMAISGEGSFEQLRFEAGVHRVQRIPATEKSGRVHTSVVSVAILPQPDEIDIVIDPKDIRIDTMRASGAGGQHVNTTNSAVRITYLPTGLSVDCQEEKSQIQNRKMALAKLRAKLYQEKLNNQLRNASTLRKEQFGMGERNEKIRTYNYMQDRVTDHRITNGTLHNLKSFLEGGEALDNLQKRLDYELKHELLLEVVKNL